MTKQEFLNELRRELSFLPAEETEDAIEYYDEYISESEDEERTIDELGSPGRVAEDFKKEYYDRNPENKELPVIHMAQNAQNAENPKRPVWLMVLIAVLIIGFGVPVLHFTGNVISSLMPLIILVLIALILFKALRGKDTNASPTVIETCSDIKSLDIRLGGGTFVIQSGGGFSVSGKNFKSEIINGVWHVSGSSVSINQKHDAPTDSSTVIITVPDGFTAQNARVRLGAGNLLIKELSAYNMQIDVSLGNIEAQKLYSTNMEIRCGVGRIKAAASMHGNVKISCGMGEASLKLTNRAEEFNVSTEVGLGMVLVNSNRMQGGTVNNLGAMYNMGIKCGMGNVIVAFGE